MVAGGDRLAALEVGVAGDDGGGVFFRAVEQGELQAGDFAEQRSISVRQ
jgi:hypothetical protein